MNRTRNKKTNDKNDPDTVCDLCKNRIKFSEGVAVYVGGKPRLLCPGCFDKHGAG